MVARCVNLVNRSQILPYQFEPEYSSREEQAESASEEEEEDEESGFNEGNVNHLENTCWCSCE